jgi:hypothetical protein
VCRTSRRPAGRTRGKSPAKITCDSANRGTGRRTDGPALYGSLGDFRILVFLDVGLGHLHALIDVPLGLFIADAVELCVGIKDGPLMGRAAEKNENGKKSEKLFQFTLLIPILMYLTIKTPFG